MTRHSLHRPARGFTLVELMITLTVLALVMIVLSTVMYTAAWSLSGKCFSIKDDVNAGTTYAQPAVTQANCASNNAGVTTAAYGTSW